MRHAVATHPRLPAGALVRLLRDTDTAEAVARHPELPVAVMERLLRWLRPPADATPGL
ncbi:hypothetical protein [Streptomyces sp. NBC_00829]|uniref:hypothetical protein n=1 Tax=Streptomyces sp. NBC_00829 TaxID=2903679 RepID=UPI0038673B7B|nr:hypothetical protein OG293_35445 [Streptomyces sp. NBC_00829]